MPISSLALLALLLPGAAADSLRPVELWAPDARIVIHHKGAETVLAPPDTEYREGISAAGALVFLAKDSEVRGLVVSGEGLQVIASQGVQSTLPAAHQEWACATESGAARASGTDGGEQASATTAYTIRVAIETDYELFQQFGSAAALTQYVELLVGTTSAIYARDLNTRLIISHLSIWSSPDDPWEVVPKAPRDFGPTFAAFDEFRAYWNEQHEGIVRSSAVMLTAKKFYGGVAFQDAACTPYGYAFCSAIVGPAVPDPNGPVPWVPEHWPLLQLAHELGHTIGGQHTHCIPLNAADSARFGRTFVDYCGSGNGCYQGPTSVPPERGTLMSYCHTFSPPETRYLIGQSGEASYRSPSLFRTYLAAASPPIAINGPDEDLCEGTAYSVSVPARSSATYAWTVNGANVSGSQSGSRVTFTPAAGVISLNVTVTSRSGCTASDSRTWSVRKCPRRRSVKK